MVRPLCIEYPGAWYHVTSRGNEKKKIFNGDQDKRRFLEILSATSTLYAVEVHAYVLMENHFHLVLTTPEANLSGFMQRFNTTYTVSYNRRHKRSGHLYQGRYKSERDVRKNVCEVAGPLSNNLKGGYHINCSFGYGI